MFMTSQQFMMNFEGVFVLGNHEQLAYPLNHFFNECSVLREVSMVPTVSWLSEVFFLVVETYGHGITQVHSFCFPMESQTGQQLRGIFTVLFIQILNLYCYLISVLNAIISPFIFNNYFN